ncbi:MAG: divalent-cation tolerance protein CutA [Anaerolineales bacterium]
MSTNHVVALITAPSKEVATTIANVLLDKKLAACANIIAPINSLYLWQGKTNQDEEVMMFVKTRADLFETEFVAAVKSVHPYDVPEIIALPILMGAKNYLDWIDEVTG